VKPSEELPPEEQALENNLLEIAALRLNSVIGERYDNLKPKKTQTSNLSSLERS